jgi:hypothetical protein
MKSSRWKPYIISTMQFIITVTLCETSRPPHFLDNRLTDGGEVITLTYQPTALYPQEDSWYSFLLEAESTPGP